MDKHGASLMELCKQDTLIITENELVAVHLLHCYEIPGLPPAALSKVGMGIKNFDTNTQRRGEPVSVHSCHLIPPYFIICCETHLRRKKGMQKALAQWATFRPWLFLSI